MTAKKNTGVTGSEVLLGVICPVALLGLWSVQAIEMQAKERKERKPEPTSRLDMAAPCILIAILIPAAIYGWATGQI